MRKKTGIFITALFIAAAITASGQNSPSDEGGRVLALEKAWGHAIELKDTKALDMMLASTFVGVEIDGSVSNKADFLAGIKDPEYQPSQAINEQINVQVYGNCRRSRRNFPCEGSGERQTVRSPRTIHRYLD